MRKHSIKTLAAALVVALCSTSIVPMDVQAATNKNAINSVVYSEEDGILLTANTLNEIAPSEYYGRNALSQLADSEKLLMIYDEIVRCVENQETYLDVSDYNITITQLQEVAEAYYNDYPQHFWLDNYHYGWSGTGATALQMYYNFKGDELEQAKIKWNNAVNELLEGIDASMSEYEREKIIYDRLAEKITYSDENENCHNAYGAIVEGKAVCEGYTKALQYILYKAGIQSYQVPGKKTATQEGHAWNLVRIDGKYYYADLTWDDGVSPMNYKYFNVSVTKIIEDHTLYNFQITLPDCWYSIVNGQVVEDEIIPDASENIVYAADCDVIFTYDITNRTAVVYTRKDEDTTSFVIPAKVNNNGIIYDVTSIGAGAFGTFSDNVDNNVESVIISEGVTRIEARAFYHCENLKQITIPSSIKYIGSSAFSECQALESVTLPDGLESIEDWCFYYCSNLKTIDIPSSVTSIGESAFKWCGNLEIIIPPGITSIGASAFDWCNSLYDIKIPENVVSIGENAFGGVYNIVHDGSIEGAPWGAKNDNGYTDGYVVYNDETKTEILAVSGAIKGDFVVPDSVTTIAAYAFEYCDKLESVIIPDSVTNIGKWAFYDCDSLKKVKLPSNLSTIEERTFFGCDSLTDITIPSSVSSIGDCAFGACYSLLNLSIMNNEKAYIYYEAFWNAPNIIADETRSNAPWGAKRINAYPEGVLLYEDDTKKELVYIAPIASGRVNIPDGVETISASFYSCDELEGIVIPSSVASIVDGAFKNCDITIYGDEGSYAQEYALENNIPFQIYTCSTATVTSNGIMMVSQDRNMIVAGHVTEVSEAADLQYRWTAYNKTTQTEIIIQDWTDNNEWLNWSPDGFGEYVITGEVRVKENPSSTATASTEAFEYNPYIKGKCQMPYWGEGGGYLIGVESYENPNQSYQYEMLILDCTLLAEGKPAWVYTTNKFTVTEGAAGWCVWQPQYGYYWTLFRVYDAAGNMIDQACYPFVNAY